MTTTIFFSWQSDVRAAACRTLIGDALEEAAAKIVADKSVAVEPVIDRDTQNVPGAPDIGSTILSKIDAATAFVADVTIVGNTRTGKPTPNPNVLIELGYALKALGWSRILLVQNTAFGGPEMLPFDLRQKRAIPYASPEDAEERAPERRALQGKLEMALREILKLPSPAATAEAERTLPASKGKDLLYKDLDKLREYLRQGIIAAQDCRPPYHTYDSQTGLKLDPSFRDLVGVLGLSIEDGKFNTLLASFLFHAEQFSAEYFRQVRSHTTDPLYRDVDMQAVQAELLKGTGRNRLADMKALYTRLDERMKELLA